MSAYVSPQGLIDRIERTLRSYHEAGQLDPAAYPTVIRKGLFDIGLGQDVPLETRLAVINHKARLPLGLQTIEELWWEPADTHQHRVAVYPTGLTPPGHHETYSRSGDTLHLNRPQGILQLLYEGTDDPSQLPQIPAEPIYEEFLLRKIVLDQLNDWYLNDEVPNLERKLEMARQLYTQAYADAQYFRKLPSFEQLVRYKKTRPAKPLYR